MNKYYKELTEFIRSSYSPDEKVKTSKDGKCTIFFRKAGKSLCYIDSLGDDSVVTVVIGSSLSDSIRSSSLSEHTKVMFSDAKQFHDGKWLFLKLDNDEVVEDIKILLNIKRPLKKRV